MTMHGKLKEPKKFETPAPNKYEVGNNKLLIVLCANKTDSP